MRTQARTWLGCLSTTIAGCLISARIWAAPFGDFEVATSTTNGVEIAASGICIGVSGNYNVAMRSGIAAPSTQTISVRSGISATINISNLNICKASADTLPALDIGRGATVTLILDGSSTLEAAQNAAIRVPDGAQLVVDSKAIPGSDIGSLYARSRSGRSAGIGADKFARSGAILLNGGTITAIGSSYAAGIGGGGGRTAVRPSLHGGDNGKVVINGGTVNATGGSQGAAIGSGYAGNGGTIVVNGGTVSATGTMGDGIGCGVNGTEGVVRINGGSVKASSITGAVVNGADKPVYRVMLTVGAPAVGNGEVVSAGSIGDVGGAKNPDPELGVYGIRNMKTCDGGKLYLYLPVSSAESISVQIGSVTYEKQVAVPQGGTSATLIATGGANNAQFGKFTLSSSYNDVYSASVARYDQSTQALYILQSGEYVLSLRAGVSQSDDHVVIGSGVRATITISDLDILPALMLDNTGVAKSDQVSAFSVSSGADVTLLLNGANKFASNRADTHGESDLYPGLHVPPGATLTIAGSGSLTAIGGYNGAGIGGHANEGAGSITINDGMVTAIGSGGQVGGAGIGGGAGGAGGTVRINGGTVRAIGWASGIGSGSAASNGGVGPSGGDVSIAGGTVWATSGNGNNKVDGCPAAIGSSEGGDAGSISISGGTVITSTSLMGTSNVADIGSGGSGAGSGSINISGGCIYASGAGIGMTQCGGSNVSTGIGGNAIVLARAVNSAAGGTTVTGSQLSSQVSNPAEANNSAIFTLNASITIPAGSTLVVPERLTLRLNGNTLTVNGTLLVYGQVQGSGSIGGTGKVMTYPSSIIDNSVAMSITSVQGIDNAAIQPIGVQVYSGRTEPEVRIVVDGTQLQAGVDFTAAYENNDRVGIAQVRITGIGSYGGTASTSFSITPKPVIITGIAVGDREYDGTNTIAPTGTPMPSSNFDGSNFFVVTDRASATMQNAAAGAGKTVTFAGYDVGGSAASNYLLLAQPTNAAVTITPKPVSIRFAEGSVRDKAYDGTTSVTLASDYLSRASIVGKLSKDKVSVVAGSAHFNSSKAGSNIPVVFERYSLGGNDASNYVLNDQPEPAAANITRRKLTVDSIEIADRQYDGSLAAVMVGVPKLNGTVGFDDVNLELGTPEFASKNASSTPVGVVFRTPFGIVGADTGNYTLVQPVAVMARIDKRPVSIANATIAPKTYDGSAAANVSNVQFANVIAPDVLSAGKDYTIASAEFDNPNAGAGRSVQLAVSLTANTTTANYVIADSSFTVGNLLIREAAPNARPDYISEQLTGLDDSATYAINNAPYSSSGGCIAFEQVWTGNNPTVLTIIKTNADAVCNSAAQHLTIAAKPPMPSVTVVNASDAESSDGKIIGTSTAMQYSANGGSTWIGCDGTSITGLRAGEYLLRIKASDASPSGYALSLQIGVGSDEIVKLSIADITFAPLTRGYAQPAATPIIISNSGNCAARIDAITSNNSNFEVMQISADSVQAGYALASWTVQPVADLSEAVHTATLSVAYTAIGSGTTGSHTASVSVVVHDAPPAGIAIDYINEQLTGFEPGIGYIINGTAATADAQGCIGIAESWMTGTANGLSVVRANSNPALNSAALAMTVPARPVRPAAEAVNESIVGRGDGKIANASAAMEISSDTGLTWLPCNEPVIAPLSTGAYLLRVKATSFSFKSAAQALNIGTGAVPKHILTLVAPNFAPQAFGYATPAAARIAIFNSGNDTAQVNVASGSPNFVVVGGNASVPNGGRNDTWAVQPAPNLSVGEYSASIVATEINSGATSLATVRFAVTKAAQAPLHISEGSIVQVPSGTTITLSTFGGSGSGATEWTSSNATVASVGAASGASVSIGTHEEGSATIAAVKNGDANYNDGKPVTIRIHVLPAGTVITDYGLTATADGEPNKSTSSCINLHFTTPCPNLGSDDVTLMGATMMEHLQAPDASGSSYVMRVHSVADEVATVVVPNIGNTAPVAMFIGPALLSATANGVKNVSSSTRLNLEFDKPIAGLQVSDVGIAAQSGSATITSVSSLNGGRTWVAALADVQQGTVNISLTPPAGYTIENSAIEGLMLFADVTPPTILRTAPKNGDINVSLNPTYSIAFSEPMSAATAGSARLIPSDGSSVVNLANHSWNADCTSITFASADNVLRKNCTYTYQISGFADAAGNLMQPVIAGHSFATQTEYKAVIVPDSFFVFDAETYGYTTVAAHEFTLTNVGSGAYANLEAHLADGSNFELVSAFSSSTLPVGGSQRLSIRPASSLPMSATPYSDVLVITADHGLMLTLPLSFSVGKAAFSALLLQYALPVSVKYDGLPKPVHVAPARNVQGLGNITVKYNGSAVAPIEAGTYAISVDVAEGEYYQGASNVPLNGALTIIGSSDSKWRYLDTVSFGAYAKRKWNNVLLMHVNRLKADGYGVSACRWYENNALLASGYSYSKGNKESNKLSLGATYRFEVDVEGGTIVSTDTIFREEQALPWITLRAFPNPASGEISVQYNGISAGDKIEIYSMSGRLVKSAVALGKSTPVSTNGLSAGTYILKVNLWQTTFVVK